MKTSLEIEQELQVFRDKFAELKDEVKKAIVGYDDLITATLIALFSQGHVLLEGVPGLGKTYLVKVLSKALGLESGRIQCTPDLMPADILGTHIVNEDPETGRRMLHFEKGPVFGNIILVDEINRATPKTQAALLEVMQEHTVTAGGENLKLPEPFFVLATQNPMEMEGTYPLPEAQLDRFLFKIRVPFPEVGDLVEISKRTTGFQEVKINPVLDADGMVVLQESLTHVPIADPITEFAAKIILATHPEREESHEKIKRYCSYGASPRGLQAMIRGARVHAVLDGRTAVSVSDIQRTAKVSLRHRMILNFEGEAESVNVDHLIEEIINSIPTPAQQAA